MTQHMRECYRHRCALNGDLYHPSGGWRNGKPRTRKCGYCGGAWRTQAGYWTIQRWRADGRYTIAGALSIHRSEAAAERHIAELDGDTHCIRFVAT